MVILSAQRMQRLAERLQQLERSVEQGGSELDDLREEMAGDEERGAKRRELDEDLASEAARVGVELETARQMDRSTLARVLSRGGAGGGGGRLWAAAEILYADGLLARAAGRESVARARWGKAAYLYGRLDPGLDLPEDTASPEERVERIRAWTEDAGEAEDAEDTEVSGEAGGDRDRR